MDKRVATIIAHKDLDGVVSSLCFRYGDDYQIEEVFFVDANNLLTFLVNHSRELANKRLIIIDLQMTIEIIKTVGVITKQFLIFDHHVTSRDAVQSARHKRIKWMDKESSEDLQLILSNEEYNRLSLVEQCSCSDICFRYNSYTGINHSSYQTLSTLVQHTRVVDTGLYTKTGNKTSLNFAKLCDYYTVETYYQRLASVIREADGFFNVAENAYLRECQDKYKAELAKASNTGVTISTNRLSIYMFSAITDMSELSEEFTSQYDVVVALNPVLNKVTFRTGRSDLNLGPFVAQYFNGGGHRTCAGFSMQEMLSISFTTLMQLFSLIGMEETA